MINQKLIDEILRVVQLNTREEVGDHEIIIVDTDKIEVDLAILLEDYKIEKL